MKSLYECLCACKITLLVMLLSFSAFAKTFNISPLPVSPYVDTEVTTNIVFNAQRIDAEKLELNLSFDNNSSNSIQVAFGRDENKNGSLEFSETDTVYGWLNGCYVIEDVRDAIRYEQDSMYESGNFCIKMRMTMDYVPKEFSASDGALQLFHDFATSVPKWLYRPKWNLMRVTRRGISVPSEWFSCKIDYSAFSITIR